MLFVTEVDIALASDGIIGFSPKKLSYDDDNYEMLLDVLYNQGSIDEKVFSLSIGYSDRLNSDSIVTIGGYDLDQFATSELAWHNLTYGSRHWDINLTKLTFGDQVLTNGSSSITVDSGSSLMVVPFEVLNELKQSLKAQGVYSSFYNANGIDILICQTRNKSVFKDLTVYIDDIPYTIPAEQMYTKMAFSVYYINLMTIRDFDMYIIGLNFF